MSTNTQKLDRAELTKHINLDLERYADIIKQAWNTGELERLKEAIDSLRLLLDCTERYAKDDVWSDLGRWIRPIHSQD